MPDALARRLRSRVLETQRRERLPSVSAAVVREGEVAWADAVGLADVEEEREAAPDTQYRIGSITKTFTAVAVMQLERDGALGLDDELRRFLPEASGASPTIRRLLSHLSGLQREPVGQVWESLQMPDDAALVGGLDEAEAVLAPHESHHYSNLAFAVLGQVVSRLAGMPYRQAIDERVIRPLGLERTTWEPAEPRAQGYLVAPYEDVAWRDAADAVDLRAVSSAGQLWSTTGDLSRFGWFLARGDDRVLDEEAVRRMRFPQVMWDPEEWTLAWGLGPMLHRRGTRIYGGHSGGMPGHISAMYVCAKDGIGAVALTNAMADMDELALDLAEAAIEELPAEQEPWRAGGAAPEALRSVLGRWWSEGAEFVFSFRDGKLEARAAGAPRDRPPSVFEPEGDDLYRTVSGRERGERLRLVRDDSGRVVRMYWATYPFEREARVFG